MTVTKKNKEGETCFSGYQNQYKETEKKNMILAQLWNDFTQWSRSQSTEIDSSK